MKKILFLSVALALCSSVAIAQHTTPRFGTASNQDATFRNQKMGLRSITDAVLQDTFTVYSLGLRTIVKVTLTDTVILFANTTDAYFGDELDFIIANTAGSNHIVRFTGRGSVASPFEVGSGTLTMAPTSAKNCTIRFLFNGTKWVELCRIVQ